MRSHTILKKLHTRAASVSGHLTQGISSIAALSSFTSSRAQEMQSKKPSVRMNPTSHSASTADIEENLMQCVRGKKSNPEIFAALLDKQLLTSEQVSAFTDDLVQAGRVEELNTLMGKYGLDPDEVSMKLLAHNNTFTFQRLLENKGRLDHLAFLFNPESPVTVVDANDNATRETAIAARRSINIIEVDTTEGYAPSHKVIPVRTPLSLFSIDTVPYNSSASVAFFSQHPLSRTNMKRHVTLIMPDVRHLSSRY